MSETPKYISSVECEGFGYTRHYIARLCRAGELVCEMRGGLWFVEEDSLKNFIATAQEKKKSHYAKLSENLKKMVGGEAIPSNAPKPESFSGRRSSPAGGFKYGWDDRPLIPRLNNSGARRRPKSFARPNGADLRKVLRQVLGSRLPETVLALTLAISFSSGIGASSLGAFTADVGPAWYERVLDWRGKSGLVEALEGVFSYDYEYREAQLAAVVGANRSSLPIEIEFIRTSNALPVTSSPPYPSKPSGSKVESEEVGRAEIVKEAAHGGPPQENIDDKLSSLRTELLSKINYLSAQTSGAYSAPSGVYSVASQAHNIDRLSNVTISSPTISGGSWTSASASGDFSGTFSGTASSLSVTSTATSTFTAGISASALSLTGSATSTASNGINLSAGCFAVNGTCVGGGSGVSGGAASKVAFFTDATTLSNNTLFHFDNSNSRLGIGTTTPNSQLTITNFSAASTSAPFFNITIATSSDGLYSGFATSSDASFFKISYASSTEIFGKVIRPEFKSEEVNSTTLDGARSIAVSGNYAYVANNARNSLAVLNISNPADPAIVAEERGPTPGTSLAGAISVFVSGHYVYVANSTRDSLAIIDVSNPANPVFLSEERGPTPGTSLDAANSVFVSGNYAYVANSTRDSLAIIDVSNPADPVFLSEERGPTPGTSLNQANSVFVSGNYAYITNGNSSSLAVVDVSNPADPIFVSEEFGPTPDTSLAGIEFVFVSGNYAYVANSTRDSLAIIDVSNPADPVFLSEERGPTPGTSLNAANSVFVSGNYAYVTSSSRAALAVIDVSDPNDPIFLSEERGPTPGTSLNTARSVFVVGNYAYVASASRDSVAVIDVGGASLSNLAVGAAKVGNLQVGGFSNFALGSNFGGSLKIEGGVFANQGGSFTRMGTTTTLASSTISWGNTKVEPALSGLVVDAAGSAISDVLSLYHLASTTATTDGIGASILFNASTFCSLTNCSGATTTATSTGRIASVLTNSATSSPQSALAFYTKNSATDLTEWARLTSEGNFGLGTTTPQWKLQVAGTLPSIALSDTSAGANLKHWVFSSMGGNLYIGTSTDAYATSTPPALTVSNAGNIGVKTTNPNDGVVEVKGGTVCVDTNSDDSATSCIASESDERLKTNITSISSTSSLDVILALNPVYFDWRANDPEVISHWPSLARYASSTHSIGLIAQQVMPVLPEALSLETVGDEEVQYYQLDYTKFIPHIIGAIKQAWQQISAILGTLADHEGRIKKLEAEVSALKIQLTASTASFGSSSSEPLQPIAGTSSSTNTESDATEDTSSPTLTLLGQNPSTIYTGSTYSDSGATVSDNVNQNLGYKVSLDGGEEMDISLLSLDTTEIGTHLLLFKATDQAGNMGTTTRTIIVETNPAGTTQTGTSPDTASSTEAAPTSSSSTEQGTTSSTPNDSTNDQSTASSTPTN